MQPEPSVLDRILAAGLLAPSAENRHYLKFELGADSVKLLATDHGSWPALPHRKMLALLAYGAVIENMALASLPFGLVMAIDVLPDADRPELIAVLRWPAAPAAPDIDRLVDALEQRHTNRRFFRRTPAAPDALVRLERATEAIPGTGLRWFDHPASRSRALRLVRLAETERFKRPALHAELFGAVRFDIGWQRSAEEWLPPGALGVEPPMRPLFALLRHWPLMRAATWMGGHALLGLRAGHLPCALAPHLGVILGDANSAEPLSNLNAGRALQRVWLAATASGLAFQPMAAATALARQRPGNGWVSESTGRALQEGLDGLFSPAESRRPYLLFRTGLAATPAVVTTRKPLSSYLC